MGLSSSYQKFFVSFTECYVGGEFLCQNQRCIPLILQCDGFNQCGDGSDEPGSCPAEWANSVVDRRWYSHTPNYYFPKTERFPDLQTTTMAFIITSISLMIVISCLIISLYKNGNRSREQEELQNQLNTISQLLGERTQSNLRQQMTDMCRFFRWKQQQLTPRRNHRAAAYL